MMTAILKVNVAAIFLSGHIGCWRNGELCTIDSELMDHLTPWKQILRRQVKYLQGGGGVMQKISKKGVGAKGKNGRGGGGGGGI